MDLIIRTLDAAPPGLQPVEVVERKGIGHPDTICDALAERICLRLCREYLERFGTILHHNVDKILLCGGSAQVSFGGGEVTQPLELYLSGRVTTEFRGERIPADDLAIDECRAWLKTHLPALDVERHVRILPRFRPGSGDLTRLFARNSTMPCSNDSSCGAGFAPLTPLEGVVLAVESNLNSPDTGRLHPAVGADIKVLGVRRDARISLAISCAMVARFVQSASDYVQAKAAVAHIAHDAARRITGLEADVIVNAGDDVENGELFLTVTGTSAEAGDDGEAGRGNRVSGLITPYRPMTLEAAAGKNPVSHVGKLYSLMACAIAGAAAREVHGVTDANCVLVSQIGRPIDDPWLVDLCVGLESGVRLDAGMTRRLEQAVRIELHRIPELRADLLAGHVQIF